MNDSFDWNALDRYFSGACSRAEAEAVARRAARDPKLARELAELERIWASGAGTRSVDVHAAWQAMHDRMTAAQRAAPAVRALRLHPAYGSRASRIAWPRALAAGLVIAASVGLWWWRTGDPRGSIPASQQVAMRAYETARGQRAEVLLADGTRALLSVASRLRVPATYGVDARDVYLQGEAYFEVHHDARVPFRVHTPGSVSQDLGTAFVVREYPGEAGATVVVASGTVALRPDTAPASRAVTLTAGEAGRLDAAGRIAVDRDADVQSSLAWTRGVLAFKQLPLGEAVRELGRWYDLDIAIPDSSLARVPYNGTFENQPVDEVLSLVARSLDLRYTRHGSRVTFYAPDAPR